MAGVAEWGTLVLADLSGFTEFVTSTELEHGPQVTKALLETVTSRLSPPFHIEEIEGDAVFASLPERALSSSGTLLDLFDAAYVAFRQKQRDMQLRTTCPCRACKAIPTLTLKLIGHYGSFVRQSVVGRSQLAGPDVILVHRLLKNSLDRRAYLLLSEAALARTGLDAIASGLEPHTEHYEHLGAVPCFFADLEPVWRRECERRRTRVEPSEAFCELRMTLPVPPPIAWDWLYSHDRRVDWTPGIKKLEQRSPGRLGPGAQSHCEHGGGASHETILDWRPFEYATTELELIPGGFRVHETAELEPTRDGGTEIVVRYGHGEMGLLRRSAFRAMHGLFEKICRRALDSLGRRLEAEREERAVACGAPSDGSGLPVREPGTVGR